jgi:2-methylisocitrate lyase-like PEP mutase family enzyme
VLVVSTETALAEAAGTLRAFRVPGRHLVLAKHVGPEERRARGVGRVPVVAASSSAVAASLGFDDGGTAPPDHVFGDVEFAARRSLFAAGADCVYPIMALDIDVITRFVREVAGR